MGKIQLDEDLIITKVIPLDGKRLKILLNTGSEIMLNMTNRLETARFASLQNEEVFQSVTTDGYELHFSKGGNYALDFSLEEAIRMSISSPESVYKHFLKEAPASKIY